VLQRLGLILVLFALPLVLRAAAVITNDGQTFLGKILEEKPEYVLMEIENGVEVRIDRPQIQFIQYADTSEYDYKREYPILGATVFCLPASYNLVAGYFFQDFGFKLEGGYWGSATWGAQLNLSKKLGESKDMLNNFSLVLGARAPSRDLNDLYAGAGFDINFKGLALEADFLNGNTNNGINWVFALHFGYVHRFN
jgi:hypothetical protein